MTVESFDAIKIGLLLASCWTLSMNDVPYAKERYACQMVFGYHKEAVKILLRWLADGRRST
jgi:hypothetical protein